MFKSIVFNTLHFFTKLLKLYKISKFTYVYDNGCSLKEKPKILILGSSFAMTSFDPNVISRVNNKYSTSQIVNFGNSRGGAYEMYLSTLRNIEKLDELDYVLISIDPHILGEKFHHYMKVEKQLFNLKQWDYLFKYHSRYMQKYNNSIRINMFSPILFLKDMFVNKCKKNFIYNGYDPRKFRNLKYFIPKDIPIYTYKPLKLFPASEFSVNYLHKLQKLLQNKTKAKLVYILHPSYDWQNGYETYCKEYDKQLVHLLQKKLGNIYITGSLYKDDFNLKKINFSDNRHLSHSGAVKFTQQIFLDIYNTQYITQSIKPLIQYRMMYKKINLDNYFTKSLEKLSEYINQFIIDKEHIVIYSFNNISRMIISLFHNFNGTITLCDKNSFLKTIPESITDDFIIKKNLIHLDSLSQYNYDGIIIADFLKYTSVINDFENLNIDKSNILDEDNSIDYIYLRMQINIFFDMIDYINNHYKYICIIGKSILYSLIYEIFNKKEKTIFEFDTNINHNDDTIYILLDCDIINEVELVNLYGIKLDNIVEFNI